MFTITFSLIFFLCAFKLFKDFRSRKITSMIFLFYASFLFFCIIGLLLPFILHQITDLLGFKLTSNLVLFTLVFLTIITNYLLQIRITSYESRLTTISRNIALLNQK